MTSDRPSPRHRSSDPDTGSGPDVLLVRVRDPRAVAAVRALAAALATEVSVREPGVLEVRGDVGALLVAAASAVPVAALPALPVPADERAVPLVELARRDELVARLDAEIARQRPGTTTGVVFCDVAGGAGATGTPGAVVLGVAAARLRAALRRSDTLAHLGDGLFVAAVVDLPVAGADEVAARTSASVRACFDEPLATAGGLFVVAPAVGVLVHPGRPEHAGADPVPLSGADLVRAVERSLARSPGVPG